MTDFDSTLLFYNNISYQLNLYMYAENDKVLTNSMQILTLFGSYFDNFKYLEKVMKPLFDFNFTHFLEKFLFLNN